MSTTQSATAVSIAMHVLYLGFTQVLLNKLEAASAAQGACSSSVWWRSSQWLKHRSLGHPIPRTRSAANFLDTHVCATNHKAETLACGRGGKIHAPTQEMKLCDCFERSCFLPSTTQHNAECGFLSRFFLCRISTETAPVP